MPAQEIKIEQQCHGYKGGHQLLASSINLSREDQDTIDRLSDISGALRPDEKFAPYITTYGLPSNEYYVVARTWQDLKARRAGCVLTRSFLIRPREWSMFGNVQGLFRQIHTVDRDSPDAEMFHIATGQSEYLPAIEASRAIELVEALFLEERQPVVVFGASTAELTITRILTAIWPAMKRSFSTCSFSLGPRTATGRPFDLIFAPKELRSRFAKWEGRRIDGSIGRDAVIRHRWSLSTARHIFEDPAPSLSKIDVLGILVDDRSGDESRLRLALLWNDLIQQSKETPTAVLGMLDILHSQPAALQHEGREIDIAVESAVRLSESMEASKRLEFLVPLVTKLTDIQVSPKLASDLSRGLEDATSKAPHASVKLLSSIVPDSRVPKRFLIVGAGGGLSTASSEFLSEGLFRELSDEYLLALLSLSNPFSSKMVGRAPANIDEDWIRRLQAALAFPTGEFVVAAKVAVVENLSSERQLPLLRACLQISPKVESDAALQLMWENSKLSNDAFDVVFIEAASERSELARIRNVLVGLPDVDSTNRLLTATLKASPDDIAWLLGEDCLTSARKAQMLSVLMEQADDALLGHLARSSDLMSGLLSTVSRIPMPSSAREAYLKLLTWSDISVDDVLPLALPLLPAANASVRGGIVADLLSKALRFAEHRSNRYIQQLLQDKGFIVNPDHLVANAVASESKPERVSDNLGLLNKSPEPVRREVLRYIDNLSFRVTQRHPEQLTDKGVVAWSELIKDAGQINLIGQLRAASAALSFAFSHTNQKASPLIVAAFPVVYCELRQGKDEPSLWSMFSPDWDRCKAVRKQLVNSFLISNWPPADLLRASIPSGDLERVLTTLLKDDNGRRYLDALQKEVEKFQRSDQQLITNAIEEALSLSSHGKPNKPGKSPRGKR